MSLPIFTVFAITAAMTCPETKMINWTKEKWTAENYISMRSAKRTCRTRYAPENPCLKKFIKKELRSFYAICGPKEPKK